MENKNRNRFLTLLVTISLVLTMIVIIPSVSAASATGVDVAPSYIIDSSGLTAVIRLDITTLNSQPEDLKKVNLSFSGSGFETTDLAQPADDASSGVSIHLDDGDGVWEGSPPDGRCTLGVEPAWDDKNISIRINGVELNNMFFVVIKTNSTISNNDVINVTVTGVTNNTDDEISLSGDLSAEITADTLDPVVPSDALTSPVGGEIWSGTHDITWDQASITAVSYTHLTLPTN